MTIVRSDCHPMSALCSPIQSEPGVRKLTWEARDKTWRMIMIIGVTLGMPIMETWEFVFTLFFLTSFIALTAFTIVYAPSTLMYAGRIALETASLYSDHKSKASVACSVNQQLAANLSTLLPLPANTTMAEETLARIHSLIATLT